MLRSPEGCDWDQTFPFMKNAIFWDMMTPCNSCWDWRYGEHIINIFRVRDLSPIGSQRGYASRRSGKREPLARAPPQSSLSVTVELLLMGRSFVECVSISLLIEEHYVGSENAVFWDIFLALIMKDFVLCDMKPCGSYKKKRRSGGTYRLNLQDTEALKSSQLACVGC
jgi:hypothetical protein